KTEEEKTDLRAGGGADAGRGGPEGTAKRAQGNAVVGETQVPAFPVSDLREKLCGFASERAAADENILDGILDLQRKMQDGLKQIREIREGVEYSFVQEAVQQLIALYCQVDDILQYHPDSGNPGGYEDLIESCGIFGENILQSIAMLGASQICDVNVRYDPQLHRTPPGVRPSRGSRITKVARPGFVYKDKVLEKARVEIDLPAQQPD
ncbi:MAG: nucleotide exchange factor GrpE, partial [Eubacteriales bacterium]|nr:nucleotide exchange factor GrpE [Eubacteriales bacterium]